MQLDESGSTTLDLTGRGVVELSPSTARQRWQVTNAAVSGTGVADPECRVYLGVERPGGLLAATYSGNGDSAPVEVVLYPGQVLTFVWSGGTPGATCTASIYGTYDVAP